MSEGGIAVEDIGVSVGELHSNQSVVHKEVTLLEHDLVQSNQKPATEDYLMHIGFGNEVPPFQEQHSQAHKLLYLDIECPSSPFSIKKLKEEKAIPKAENIDEQNLEDIHFDSADSIHVTIPYLKYVKIWTQAQREGRIVNEVFDEHPLLPTDQHRPDTIVIRIPKEDGPAGLQKAFIYRNKTFYDQIYYETVTKLPPEKRPRVVFYTDNFEPPLHIRSNFQSFFFCSSPQELKETIELSTQMKKLKDENHYKPEALEPMQEESYNSSTDLREWETETADTYQSLKHIHKWFMQLNTLYKDTTLQRLKKPLSTGLERLSAYDLKTLPDRPIKTILDLGTGEGRIAGILARIGYNVFGLDISPEMLKRAQERIYEEGKGFRGESNETQLSYPALRQLINEGEVNSSQVFTDQETANHYLTAQGSFFNLHRQLHELVLHWEEKFPGIDKYQFFNTTKSDLYAFSDKEDQFTDAGFDSAIITWHTFCEVGDPVNQKEVLRQIQNVLWPGGELIIEIPDRDEEPYKSSVEAYHMSHPDSPYGTVRDLKPDGGEFPPRFFPGKDEMVRMLRVAGYDIDLEKDVRPYTIIGANGKQKIKELFIVARKSNMRGDLAA